MSEADVAFVAHTWERQTCGSCVDCSGPLSNLYALQHRPMDTPECGPFPIPYEFKQSAAVNAQNACRWAAGAYPTSAQSGKADFYRTDTGKGWLSRAILYGYDVPCSQSHFLCLASEWLISSGTVDYYSIQPCHRQSSSFGCVFGPAGPRLTREHRSQGPLCHCW